MNNWIVDTMRLILTLRWESVDQYRRNVKVVNSCIWRSSIFKVFTDTPNVKESVAHRNIPLWRHRVCSLTIEIVEKQNWSTSAPDRQHNWVNYSFAGWTKMHGSLSSCCTDLFWTNYLVHSNHYLCWPWSFTIRVLLGTKCLKTHVSGIMTHFSQKC